MPSRTDLESVAKSSNRTPLAKGVKDISLSEKNFHNLESSITESVKGISLLQSMLRSLFPMIAHDPEPEGVDALIRDRSEVDATDLGYLISGVLDTVETLAQNTLHQRTQLSALYRDRFLETSGFDDADRTVLRSLTLEKESLFHPPWMSSFLDKRRMRVQEDAFVSMTQTSSGSRGMKRSHSSSNTRGDNKKPKGAQEKKSSTSSSKPSGRGRSKGKRTRHGPSKPSAPKPEPRV